MIDHSPVSKPYGTSAINTQWSYAGTSPTQPTTQDTGNRWTNMNVPRPQGATYGHTTTWQQQSNNHHQKPTNKTDLTSVWSGTAVHVDQHNPSHTVIYEEGSFEPNRNYNRPMYNTPLAPLKPTTTTTTTTASNIVYAQPVGSQEDSKEIFFNTPTKPTSTYFPQYYPTSNRQNHTRHLNPWTPIRPVDLPRHELMPPHQGHNTVYTNTHVQIPTTSQYIPPNQNTQPSPQYPNIPQIYRPIYGTEDAGQKPLPESDFKITTINIDQLPGQIAYNLDDLDQLPSASSRHDNDDNSNFYGGLQPPLDSTSTTTTFNSFLNPQEQSTQLPQPPKTTWPMSSVIGYPKLSNSTIQTFPNQPHYSRPYSEVTHSRNVSWVGRKVPQHSAIKPSHRDPLNSDNSNVKISNTLSPPYYGLNRPLYSNSERKEDNPYPEDQEEAMKEALKLLLRPYLDNENKADDEVAEKVQSHIMNLVSHSDSHPATTSTTTTHKPPLNINTLVPTTTPHQEDVELILAGEQHSLVGVSTIQTGNHETSTSYNLHQTPIQSHDHNSNWHKHHFHDPHHFKIQHSRDFHEKHPNIPIPFEDTTIPISSYNPQTEATTPRNYNFELGIGGDRCPFECGNGKCAEQHQVS